MTIKELVARLNELPDDHEVAVEDECVNNGIHYAVVSLNLGPSSRWLDGEIIEMDEAA